MKQRNDDFLERRKHLEKMSDEALKAYFYELTDKIVDPLLKLAYEYTTPAIERSVLMRMGFSSLESKTIVDRLFENDLLPYGAGHVVYIYATKHQLPIRDAGLKLLEIEDFKSIKENFK
jgi:D-ornithine 4,5-aminomutase subunit alpha